MEHLIRLKLIRAVVAVLTVCMCFRLRVQGQDIVFRDDDISSKDNGCYTPKGARGECVDILSCPILMSLISKQDQHEFLRQSRCGWNENIPMVCCDKNWNCTTPNNEPGYCVKLPFCSHINDTVTKSTVSQEISSCGSEDFNICCTSLSYSLYIQVDVPTTKSPTEIPNIQSQDVCEMTSTPPDPMSKCCGRGVGSNRIIGGEDTAIDEYPWSVAIEYSNNDVTKVKCGGTLISGKYVVSAAHCLFVATWTPVNVRLGDYDIDNPGADCVEVEGGGEDCTDEVVIIPIEKTIPYPYYSHGSLGQIHDIAVIKLRDIAPYTDFIRPICLPKSDITETALVTLELRVAGWGATSEYNSYSSVKRHVSVPFVRQEDCLTVYRRSNVVLGDGQMCAGGEKGKDSCKGDSGGALMFIDDQVTEIVGITSFGYIPCGAEKKPAVYTKIYRYLPWIQTIIRNN